MLRLKLTCEDCRVLEASAKRIAQAVNGFAAPALGGYVVVTTGSIEPLQTLAVSPRVTVEVM